MLFLMLYMVSLVRGYIQTILETTGIAYTHSGVIASALAMDKILSKKFL